MTAAAELAAHAAPKTHVSLNVRDIDASVAFYEAFFGVPAHKRRPGYANFDVPYPALKLALQEHAPAESGLSRLSHLGIQVATTAEVNAARERLEASGRISFDEGDTVCCYARQDKVWATDPDGNGWEIYVLLDDMDDEHETNADACCTASARASTGEAHACCAGPVAGSACCS